MTALQQQDTRPVNENLLSAFKNPALAQLIQEAAKKDRTGTITAGMISEQIEGAIYEIVRSPNALHTAWETTSQVSNALNVEAGNQNFSLSTIGKELSAVFDAVHDIAANRPVRVPQPAAPAASSNVASLFDGAEPEPVGA